MARANQNARIQPRCRTPSSGAPAHCIQHPHQRLKSKRPGPMMLSPALSSCMPELTLPPLMMSHGNAKPDHSDMATPEWPHVYYGGKHTDTTALKPLQTTTQPCPGKRPGKASKHAHTWGTTAPSGRRKPTVCTAALPTGHGHQMQRAPTPTPPALPVAHLRALCIAEECKTLKRNTHDSHSPSYSIATCTGSPGGQPCPSQHTSEPPAITPSVAPACHTG